MLWLVMLSLVIATLLIFLHALCTLCLSLPLLCLPFVKGQCYGTSCPDIGALLHRFVGRLHCRFEADAIALALSLIVLLPFSSLHPPRLLHLVLSSRVRGWSFLGLIDLRMEFPWLDRFEALPGLDDEEKGTIYAKLIKETPQRQRQIFASATNAIVARALRVEYLTAPGAADCVCDMGENTGNVEGGDFAPLGMDVDSDVAVKSTHFSFNVLQLIKTAQAQHGLRHSDYIRYRRYCTARLRRLYKSLKFTHGRGKYIKKKIVEATVTDVRFLHIVLYLAERAWSYAMAIKQTTDGSGSRQRFHLVGRLSKAVKWADLFSHLCAEKADPRTSLEAVAYASYMKGSYLLEREENWDSALKNFKSARAIYEELGKYGDVENQVLCRQRVDELEPNVRYCLYKLGHSNMRGSELLDLSTQEGPALDLLQGKLEAVMAEARSQQAVTMTELQWLGRKFPINNAKTRVCIVKGQQLEKDLLGTPTNTLSSEKKLTVYDKIFGAYQDARRHIREDLVTAGTAEDVKDDLNGLDKAVSCIIIQRTIDRNQLLVTIAKNRLNRQQQSAKEDKGEKLTKPEELVRLYDILIQNITDLSDLTTSGRERSIDEASFAMELSVKKLSFQAERCFYLAQSYSSAGKYAEAYVLYHRACEHTDSALQSCQQMKNLDEAVMHGLRELSKHCRMQSCLVHATGVAEATKIHDSLQKGVELMSLTQESTTKKKDDRYLLERLDQYEPVVAVSGSKEPPRIAQLPPPFQEVPCKPIVLDTAVNAIEFPSLEGRLKKEDKKKSLFGWWRS